MKRYLHGGEETRRKLGAQCGRKPNLTLDESDFVGIVLARVDRGNEGKNRQEAIDIVMELNPSLDRAKASKALTTHVLRKSEKVKASLVLAQSTMTKRSAITVDQQFHWHKTLSMHVLSFLN